MNLGREVKDPAFVAGRYLETPPMSLKSTGHRSGGAALAPAEDSWGEF